MEARARTATGPDETVPTTGDDSVSRTSGDAPAAASSTSKAAKDGIDQLVEEHRALERLFDEFDAPSRSAWERKGRIIGIRQAISENEDIETSALATVIRSRLAAGHHRWRSLRRRYRAIDKLLEQIERRSISSPDLPELLERVMTAVDELITEQESSTSA